MGKQKRKTPGERPVPANAINWQKVAHDLYKRGLISRAALGGSSPPEQPREMRSPSW